MGFESTDDRFDYKALRSAARREGHLWLYRKGQWDGRGLRRGDDEFGRFTLVLRLPGHRAIVWAYWTCGCSDCHESRVETARWAAEDAAA